MKTFELMLYHYKHRKNLKTDTELAGSLGVQRTALANYKSGDRRMPDSAICKLAEGLGVTEKEVMAAMNLNLKKQDEEPLFWAERLSQGTGRYGVISAVVFFLSVNLFLTEAPSQGAPVLKHGNSTLYIMSNLVRKLRQRLFNALKAFRCPAPDTQTA